MDSFYRAFEDRHRGSRELIKGRLSNYLPFVQPLAALHPGAKTFDVGCGRGEWLELMGEAGFAATGVDLDADMLEACRERNLSVSQGDAIEHLAKLDSNSHGIISAFHVVEHVSFRQLKRLVIEALRVLKPGGLLILETPNPENIAVATCNFYMDPTHQKPIPPLLLSFVAEHAGFDRVKVVRLQESATLTDAHAQVHFMNVLGGVSPDYAVVAQKEAASTQGAFDDAFEAEYGLTIDVLAQRYETQLASSIARIEAKVQHAEEVVQQSGEQSEQLTDQLHSVAERLQRAEEVVQQSGEQSEQLTDQLHSVAQRLQLAEERYQLADGRRQEVENLVLEMQTRLQQTEAMLHQANAQLDAVYQSTSWRITRPVRGVKLVLKGQGKVVFKVGLKRAIQRAAKFGGKHPWFRRLALSALNRVPGVKQRLIPVVLDTVHLYRPLPDAAPEGLSPRAQQTYAALAFAVKSYEKREEG
ncbi:class I SAM-dependent methyltransferase [Paraburkholderia mimosarum]|uniref:class I SAM-dependent methyltransferase n=1 Tax=Paraburkholderia mimosarum TaxID=312026 RepID=UPI000426BD64|nr:class I SAM-dependent methyltransferase [Paraburkholderia mimosarum]